MTMVFCGCARFWETCCLTTWLLFAGTWYKSAAADFHYFATSELNSVTNNSARLILPVHLEGVVLWVSPGKDSLYLQQHSNLLLVEADLRNHTITASDQIEIEGQCLVGDHGARFTFGTSPLVDNNGVHAEVERTGQIYLTAGRHPFRVGYFNRLGDFAFSVHVQGPDGVKRFIPAASLFHEAGPGSWQNGVVYRCFEGKWNRLPDFGALKPVSEGVLPIFDLAARTQSEEVALEFTGALQI
jgi:hypothetical protein